MCICRSLNISETGDLKFCMKLGINKVKKVKRLEFLEKILIRGLSVKNLGLGAFSQKPLIKDF